MTQFIEELFTNRILLSVALSIIVASAIKILTNWIMTDKLDISVAFKTGGMPSSHAATVISLTSAIYLHEGMTSLFFVSFIYAMLILGDAVGVRQSSGKQAAVLNEMIDDIKALKSFKTKKLYELLGHTPRQVIAGSILGIFIAKLVFILF